MRYYNPGCGVCPCVSSLSDVSEMEEPEERAGDKASPRDRWMMYEPAESPHSVEGSEIPSSFSSPCYRMTKERRRRA